MESMSPAISKLQTILAAKPDWKGIDEVVEACEKASFFDSRFRQEAEGRAKKVHIRRLIATLKDEEGFPLYASITVLGKNGEPQRVYKQEMLFDPEDYKKVVKYHLGLSEHHRNRAAGYVDRCAKTRPATLVPKHGVRRRFAA